MLPSGVGRHAECLEKVSHCQAADKDERHRAPRSDARKEQNRCADQNRQRRGFAHAAGNESQESVRRRITHRTTRSELFEGRSTRNSVVGEPDLLTRNKGRVGEKHECTRHQRGIEDIHTRTAEDLLAEDDGESRTQRDHPERRTDRHNHRDQQTRHEETFIDFVSALLGEKELDAQTDHVGNHDHRQHLEETEPKGCPAGHAHLVARIVHTEQQGRHQRHDHHDHRTLHIVAITDMGSSARGRIRHEKERFERIEGRCEERKLAAFGEGRLDFIYEFS